MAMIRDFYEGKTVLLTGCTGFLGKVLLEKLLWSCSAVQQVFILIRPKKGMQAIERFQKEIVQSPCFDRLRDRHADFRRFMGEKVQVLPGDIQMERLGLSQAHYAQLTSSVHVVINSAANVDFTQRLDLAVQNNVLGSLHLLELCQHSPNIQTFLHISTAYVNSDREGWIEEKFYPQVQDPDMLLAEIMQVPVEEIERKTQSFLGKFPNTYNYTKNLAEQLLLKRRGTVPLVVVRPTIVGGAWKEPYPGWVDGLSSAGAFYLSTTLGIVRVGLVKKHNIGDQIPCDLVVNACLVAAAQYAESREVRVIHSSSSQRNPLTWEQSSEPIYSYCTSDVPERNFDMSGYEMHANKAIYQLVRFVKRTVPGKLLTLYAHLSRNPAKIKLAALFHTILAREEKIVSLFSHFTLREWVFESEKVIEMKQRLSRADRKDFFLDIAKVDWKTWCMNFLYGLRKWVLREKMRQPADLNTLEVNQQFWTMKRFGDFRWAYSQELTMKVRPRSEIQALILKSDRVQRAIQAFAVAKEPPISSQQAVQTATRQASEIVQHMVSDFNPTALRVLGWVMKKVWRNCYEKVLVDAKGLRTLKKLALKGEPIVFLPTSRSYVDFLLVSFVLFMFGVKVPFIAAREDFLRIFLLNRLFRQSGAFFISGKIAKKPLYAAILTEYVQLLLRDGHNLQFFLEGRRSCTGKSRPPKLDLLEMCTEAYLTQQITDLHLVPVAISYEKVLEGETFPWELLGEQKVAESLGRILRSFKVLNMNFGQIHVNFGIPITLSKFRKENEAISQVEMTKKLGFEVIYRFNEQIVATPPALVASLLLLTRTGVTETQLACKLQWLQSQIVLFPCKLGGNSTLSSVASVQTALQLLKPTITSKSDGIDTLIAIKPDFLSISLLSYYRNTLISAFLPTAYVACALFSLLQKGENVETRTLVEETAYLAGLLKAEFVSRPALNSAEEALGTIQALATRGVLEIAGNTVQMGHFDDFIAYFSSFLWPLVDTYWVMAVFAYELLFQPRGMPLERLIKHIQHLAEGLYQAQLLSFYETRSKAGIKTAIRAFRTLGVLEVREKAGKRRVWLGKLYSNEEKLQELADRIGTFRKATLVKSAHTESKKVLFAHYPHTPKPRL